MIERPRDAEATQVESPGKETEQRRAFLATYLDQLTRMGSEGGEGIGEAPLGVELETWERRAMESCLASAEMSKWPALVVEGVAFQKKASTELGWLAGGTAAEIDAVDNLVGVLTADAAVGLALLEETQRSIDMMGSPRWRLRASSH